MIEQISHHGSNAHHHQNGQQGDLLFGKRQLCLAAISQLHAGGSCTVDRDAYRLVQTPQTFQAPMLKKAYAQPYVPQFTDDASVVEAMGVEVTLVQGCRDNIKLTTPEDMQLAEALLQCSASSRKQKED